MDGGQPHKLKCAGSSPASAIFIRKDMVINMEEKYTTPKIEVVKLDTEDIVTTSSEMDWDGNGHGHGHAYGYNNGNHNGHGKGHNPHD